MAEPRPPAAGGPSYRRVLRQGPFLRLWLSQLVSQSGDFVFAVALLWLVLEVTGSVVDVSVVFAATILPGVVAGPFLGVYVDRWDRRRTLVYTNVGEGVLVAALSGLVLAHAVDLGAMVAVVLALGGGASIVRAASNAMVPQIVGPADLSPANALSSFSSSFNQIVGFTVGGVVVALVGPTIPIEYDALTFFAAALIVASIAPGVGRPATTGAEPHGFGREFAEGWRFLRSQRALVQLLLLGFVVNCFGNALDALLAPYTKFVLGAGASGYGLLLATVAAGSVLGALALGRVDTRRSAGKFLLGGGCAVGIAIAGLGLAHALGVALGVALVLGVTLSVTNLPISSLFQAKVPGRLLGRVGAVAGALISGAGPLGALVAGPLAERVSIPTFYLVSGLLIAAIMAVGSVVLRELRDVTYGETP